MKTSELMIGDWVMYDEFIDKSMNHPIKITHLEKDSFLTKYYYPIPLTPEILEKNGIEEGWSEPFKGYNLMVLTNGYYSIEDHCLIEFKYVHELQHILKIIGINKEIEL